MMFRRKTGMKRARALVAGAGFLVFAPAVMAQEAMGRAVIPISIIYPGETIVATKLDIVEVTNPNLKGDYAHEEGQVVGMIAKKTVLPGHVIYVSDLREPYAVQRGSQVQLRVRIGNLVITAKGSPLEDAAIGDFIRVRNLDSGIIVSGTVMQDGAVEVAAK
ncbi:flagellar basal body P-ring formation chaperone FlgA [Rhizobium sp. PAMB 3182]